MRLPWKPDPDDIRGRREAQRRLQRVMADWPAIEAATGTLREHRVRNAISERAFALRDKGDQR